MLARLGTLFAVNRSKYLAVCVLIASLALLSGCAGVTANTNSGGGPGGGGSLAISTASLSGGTVSAAYSATLQASGGTTPYSWSVSTGSLPAGLTLSSSSGSISGTPTASGTSTFTVQVEDASSNTATKSLSIAIAAAAQTLAISTSSLSGGTVGTAYSATLQGTGGTTPYAWSVSSGSLPAGLTVNASSGAISGTPTASGTSTFTAQVKDASNNTATKSLSIAVSAATGTLSVSTSSLAAGTAGTAYSATLQAGGGTTPYTWSVSTGSLPAGLTLTGSSGAISGTPTTSGTSTFTVKVTDASSNTATKSLSIAISAASQPLSVTTTSVPNGSTNTTYSAFLYAGGGKTPYTWSISSGALAAGLTLSTGGDITGVPTTAGSSSFTVKVTDSSSPANTATATFSLTVAQGTAYSVDLTWTASPSTGVAGYNVYRSTVSGSGYVLVNTSSVSSLTFTDGTVLDGTTYYYVVTAVDGSGNESAYSTQVQMAIP